MPKAFIPFDNGKDQQTSTRVNYSEKIELVDSFGIYVKEGTNLCGCVKAATIT